MNIRVCNSTDKWRYLWFTPIRLTYSATLDRDCHLIFVLTHSCIHFIMNRTTTTASRGMEHCAISSVQKQVIENITLKCACTRTKLVFRNVTYLLCSGLSVDWGGVWLVIWVLLLFCGVCGVVCVVCCDFERNSDTYFGWFLSIRFVRIRVQIGTNLDFEVVIFYRFCLL